MGRSGKVGWFARSPDLEQLVLHYLYRALR